MAERKSFLLRMDPGLWAELEAWAETLEQLGAPLTAAFVREAKHVYGKRGLLAA